MNEHSQVPASNSQSEQSRLLALQGLRAVAALLVALRHAIDSVSFAVGIPRQAGFHYWKNFGSVGVDIFFVISGFIVSRVAVSSSRLHGNRLSSAGHFLKRRITRIFPLYWILSACMFVNYLLYHRDQIPSLPVLTTLFLLPTFSFPAQPPMLYLGWTLVFEFAFYLVLTTFILITPKAIVRNTALFLCGLVAVGILVGFRQPLLVWWMNPLILEFVLGCIIGLLFDRFPGAQGRPAISLPFAGLGIVLLAATVITGYRSASEMPAILGGTDCWLRLTVWGLPSALLVGGVVFWNPAMRSLPAQLLAFLGDASYSIYLSLVPALRVTEQIWRLLGKPDPDLTVFLDMIFCTAIGVFVYFLVERPLVRFFKNWYKPIPFAKVSA